ncbi:MAG: hypothetical protein ABI488_17730 [Polyangiaceae bacterium]
MKAIMIWALLGVSTLLAAPAWAADSEGDAPQAEATKSGEKTGGAKDTFGHGSQFGFRAGLVGGYNMIFRYDQSPICAAYKDDKAAKDQQKVCGHGAPAALDLAISFAPLEFVEPYLFMRLGLASETETDTLPLKVLGVGARIYTMSDSAFKIFIEPALGLEFEKGGNNQVFQRNHPSYKSDMLLHLAAGPQLDFAKYVGVFVDAGLTTGVLRAIHTELELQGGVQARFP